MKNIIKFSLTIFIIGLFFLWTNEKLHIYTFVSCTVIIVEILYIVLYKKLFNFLCNKLNKLDIYLISMNKNTHYNYIYKLYFLDSNICLDVKFIKDKELKPLVLGFQSAAIWTSPLLSTKRKSTILKKYEYEEITIYKLLFIMKEYILNKKYFVHTSKNKTEIKCPSCSNDCPEIVIVEDKKQIVVRSNINLYVNWIN